MAEYLTVGQAVDRLMNGEALIGDSNGVSRQIRLICKESLEVTGPRGVVQNWKFRSIMGFTNLRPVSHADQTQMFIRDTLKVIEGLEDNSKLSSSQIRSLKQLKALGETLTGGNR